jgi:hypothetical protein
MYNQPLIELGKPIFNYNIFSKYRFDNNIGCNKTSTYIPVFDLENTVVKKEINNEKVVFYNKLIPIHDQTIISYEKKKRKQLLEYSSFESKINYKNLYKSLFQKSLTFSRIDLEKSTLIVLKNMLGVHDVMNDDYKILFSLCIKSNKLFEINPLVTESNYDKLVLLVSADLLETKRFYTKLFTEYFIKFLELGIEIVIHKDIESLMYSKLPKKNFKSFSERNTYIENIITNID